MTEIAIISDIHGNLEALKTVLKDIKKRKINHIYCLGDIIGKGMHSEECLNLIRQECQIMVRGNWEEFISKDKKIFSKKRDITRYEFLESQLSKENLEYLKSLPFSYDFYLSGRRIRIFHATPLDTISSVLSMDTLENYYHQFLPSEYMSNKENADIVIYGHIHMQYMQKLYNRTLINAGSVGNSFDIFRNNDKDTQLENTIVASYVIVKGIYGSTDISDPISFEFVNLSYDVEKELSANCKNIEKEDYAKELRTGLYRNIEKYNQNFKCIGIDINKI